jgi:hypothetical protein
MLDHLFLDTVAALRAALDESLLERSGQDDRLVYDIFTGDLVWETSVTLPGDGDPPRVNADLSMDWPMWSQSAWRGVSAGEAVDDPPEIGIELVFRVQRLARRPSLSTVLSVLPEESPEFGTDKLARSAPIIEESYEDESTEPEVAAEVAYEGSYRLPAPSPEESQAKEASLFPGWSGPRLSSGDALRSRLGPTRQVSDATQETLRGLGIWVASTLVQLADLDLEYLPPIEPDE